MRQKFRTLFNKNNIQETLLDIMFILFLLSLLYRLTSQILNTYSFDSWQISEFLINYEGGFVRRGLLGQLLFFVSKNFNLNLEFTIKLISLISYVAVSIFFVTAFLKKGYILYILPLCFFLGMGILSDYWVRKDYLMLGVFILILQLYQGRFPTAIKIATINFLFILVLLTHEVFAFFSLPAVLLLFFNHYKSNGVLRSCVQSLLSLTPSIFCFFLTLYYHGNSDTVKAIWNSWQIILNDTSVIKIHPSASAIESIQWTSEYAFNYHLRSNFIATDKGIFSSLIWCITFPIIYYVTTNVLMVFRKTESTFTNHNKMVLSSILIFQLSCLLPVFILLSCDYVRLLFYWTASSFAIFLIVPTKKIASLIPSFFSMKIYQLNTFFSNILFPRKSTLAILMFFTSASSYSFYIDSLIRNSMIFNIFFILSKPFVIIDKYLHLLS